MTYLKYTSAPPELSSERRNAGREIIVEFNTPMILADRGFSRPT